MLAYRNETCLLPKNDSNLLSSFPLEEGEGEIAPTTHPDTHTHKKGSQSKSSEKINIPPNPKPQDKAVQAEWRKNSLSSCLFFQNYSYKVLKIKEKARPPSRLWNSLTVQLMIPISSRAGSLPPADHCLTTLRLLLLISSTLLFRNRKMCPTNGLLHFCLCLSSCCGVWSGLCDPYSFFIMRNRTYNMCLTSWTTSASLPLRIILSSQQWLCWSLFYSLGYRPIWISCIHCFTIPSSKEFITYKTLPILALGDINRVSQRKRAHPLPFNLFPLLGTIGKYFQHFF